MHETEKITHHSLLQMLRSLQQSGKEAWLFVDEGGWSSEGGKVTEIQGEGDAAVIHLSTGKSFLLRSIVAVNGVFLTGFSTC